MFTDEQQIRNYLNSHHLMVDEISYISKGCMTDKYRFKSGGKWYIVRCYPAARSWLAEAEFNYLRLFISKGIKVPAPVLYEPFHQALLVYEELPGNTLSEVYDDLTQEERNLLCQEVADNYKKISAISVGGFGAITGFNQFSHSSWQSFLHNNISLAEEVFVRENNHKLPLVKKWKKCACSMTINRSYLVWSDFSVDNIIVNNKHLAGFIDFEGLIGGDPLLGLGYLIAHEGNSDWVSRLFACFYIDNKNIRKRIDFYSVFRYIRLVPYLGSNLPNGSAREPISAFLPYSFQHMNDDSFKSNWICRILTSLKTYILLITVLSTILAMCCIPKYYGDVLRKSQVNVEFHSSGLQIQHDMPVWFQYTDSVISVSRLIGEEERLVLKSLVSDTASVYNDYIQAVNRLTFQSNISYDNFSSLLILTFCFVLLGCSSRSFYDYIGHECFKEGQDMQKWWPWYLYRMVICVPITSVLIVAARTSLFSNLFTLRDLNIYLVVSFLAGFSIMEFLTMLRRVSKTMFDGK